MQSVYNILVVNNVYWDDRVVRITPHWQENMGSIINIPIRDYGVLNIDCRELYAFLPKSKYIKKAKMIQNLSAILVDMLKKAEEMKILQ